MDNRQTGAADWTVPAVLVAAGVGLLFALGLALAVAAQDRSEAPPLIQDLDVYTQCLVDHGADVPRVEVGHDGGFTVSVPGSLIEGGFDESAWRHAAEECGAVAPNLFAGMLAEFSGDWFEIVPEDFFEDIVSAEDSVEIDGCDVYDLRLRPGTRRPGARSPGGRDVLLDDLERRCERLADSEDVDDKAFGPRIDRLRRQCERLDR
jgi:hypothetical protein